MIFVILKFNPDYLNLQKMDFIIIILFVAIKILCIYGKDCLDYFDRNQDNHLLVDFTEEINLRIWIDPGYQKFLQENNFIQIFKPTIYDTGSKKIFEGSTMDHDINRFNLSRYCDYFIQNNDHQNFVRSNNYSCSYSDKKPEIDPNTKLCNIFIILFLNNYDLKNPNNILSRTFIYFNKTLPKKSVSFDFKITKNRIGFNISSSIKNKKQNIGLTTKNKRSTFYYKTR